MYTILLIPGHSKNVERHSIMFKLNYSKQMKIKKTKKKKYSTFNIRAASWENQQSAYAKTKTQISFAVTAKLIRAFVFATRIVQFLFYLNPKFQASSSFLCLYRPVCVGPVRKPHCWFSHEEAHTIHITRDNAPYNYQKMHQ